VEVPATSANLGPGFDCCGLALELCNRVEVEEIGGTTCEIEIAGCGTTELSRGPDNLVLVAMRHLFAKQGRELPGVRLRQHNAIPLCSGLGSSAAAEISGLVAANELLDRPYTNKELGLVALELENHPDNIIPALEGGLVVAVAQHLRRGWQLDYTRLEPPPLTAVIATPSLKVETVESRRRLPMRYSRADAVFNIGHAALLVASLVAGDWSALASALDDKIHQPYRLAALEGAPEVIAAAKAAGAIGAVLSGSGPTILALCEGDGEAIATAMKACWQRFGVTVDARCTRPRAAGAVVGD
jgi:homoserine kinase